MPPGQTPHTVIVYAHGDLVDAVQPGAKDLTASSVPYGFSLMPDEART